MLGVIICTISLALANFGVEAWRDTSDYVHAGLITWEQFVAITIYYWLWVCPEE
jgi:hypothetical protein